MRVGGILDRRRADTPQRKHEVEEGNNDRIQNNSGLEKENEMANANTMCTAALVEMMNATHAIGTVLSAHSAGNKDMIKAALYLASATINDTTTAYVTSGEVTGSGYTAGGITATNGNLPTSTGKTAFWTPSASLVYSSVTITASAFDAVLFYNATASGNKAISVHNFGSQTVTAGTFTLTMPVNDSNTGLIRMTVLP